MAVLMAQPWKHPESGVYWFRKAVPADLRGAVGKSEIKFSLRTKKPAEARRLHSQKHAEILQQWASLRGEVAAPLETPKSAALTDAKTAEALAGLVYERVLQEPYSQGRGFFTATNFGLRVALHQWVIGEQPNAFPGKEPPDYHRYMEETFGTYADAILKEHGYFIPPAHRHFFLASVGRACCQAWMQVLKLCGGDYRPDADAGRFPRLGYTLDQAWADYIGEYQPADSTRARWRPAVEGLKAFSKTNDISQLTQEVLIAWKQHLLAKPLDPVTVRDVYLAAIRTILNAAKRNLKVSENPAAGIHVHVPKKEKLREREFTIEEARIILGASLRRPDSLISQEHAAARRWVPWICCYTGARVNEITQLRKCDVLPKEGVWVIHITPEAGRTKSGEARYVPLHDHLIEQGFLAFVERAEAGPLFYDPKRGRGASAVHPLYARVGQKLAEWVRGLGVDDLGVDPNHGWRHYFRSAARRAGVPEERIDAIEGHSQGSVGRRYGSFGPAVLAGEIRKIPRLSFSPELAIPRASEGSDLAQA